MGWLQSLCRTWRLYHWYVVDPVQRRLDETVEHKHSSL